MACTCGATDNQTHLQRCAVGRCADCNGTGYVCPDGARHLCDSVPCLSCRPMEVDITEDDGACGSFRDSWPDPKSRVCLNCGYDDRDH